MHVATGHLPRASAPRNHYREYLPLVTVRVYGCLGLVTVHHHHHYHRRRLAGEGRRVVAPPCPRSTARLQRGLQWDGWSRFVAGRATCSVDDQVGNGWVAVRVIVWGKGWVMVAI